MALELSVNDALKINPANRNIDAFTSVQGSMLE